MDQKQRYGSSKNKHFKSNVRLNFVTTLFMMILIKLPIGRKKLIMTI